MLGWPTGEPGVVTAPGGVGCNGGADCGLRESLGIGEVFVADTADPMAATTGGATLKPGEVVPLGVDPADWGVPAGPAVDEVVEAIGCGANFC